MTDAIMISPVLRVEWQHEFKDKVWTISESFAAAPPGGSFQLMGDLGKLAFELIGENQIVRETLRLRISGDPMVQKPLLSNIFQLEWEKLCMQGTSESAQ